MTTTAAPICTICEKPLVRVVGHEGLEERRLYDRRMTARRSEILAGQGTTLDDATNDQVDAACAQSALELGDRPQVVNLLEPLDQVSQDMHLAECRTRQTVNKPRPRKLSVRCRCGEEWAKGSRVNPCDSCDD